MSLKKYLTEFEEYEPAANDPVINKVYNIISFLESRHGESGERKNHNIEELAKQVIPRFENNHLSITAKEMRVVILLFQHKFEERLLCERHENIKKLLASIDTIKTPHLAQKHLLRFLYTLNRNFHRYTNKSLKYAKEMIVRIKALSEHEYSLKKAKLYLETYSRFPIYEKNGFNALVFDLIDSAGDHLSLSDKLRKLNIPLADNSYNILYSILNQYLQELPRRMKVEKGIDPYYSIFKPDVENSKDLKFGLLKGKVIESLLNYFVENNGSEKVRKEIIEYIDNFVGDPRIKKYRSNWKDVNEELRKVYLKYKVKVSVSFFFGFISAGADKSETGQRHWEQRRKYWTWYLENELIDDAWVILGSSAESAARAEIKDSEFQQYGTGNLREYNKSHIMMQIGNIICVECSHNGALWIFDIDDDNCPPLGESKYYKEQFRFEPDRGYLAHSQGWQQKLDERIQERTSIRVNKLRRGY